MRRLDLQCSDSGKSAAVVFLSAATALRLCANFLSCIFVTPADPGPLPLVMMFRAYLTAELDKLLQFPEYSEVLLLDTSPPEPPEPQAGSSKESAEPPSKRTRQQATKASVTKVQKPPVQEGAPPDPLDKLKGLGQQQAEAYNLNDLKEVVELSEFLDSNGGWELFVTRKDGNCLYSSFLKGAEVPEEYRPMHLRFQLVLFCCQNHGFCFTVLKNHIMGEYGHPRISRDEYLARQKSKDNPLTDVELEDYQRPGPFCFIDYLKHLMEPGTWGDHGTISLIGMMWNCSITLVQIDAQHKPKEGEPHTFLQHKVRHNKPMNQVDFLIVYAGGSHYLGTCKYTSFFFSGSNFTCTVRRQLFQCGSRRL